MHNRFNVKEAYASYLLDYGEGYNRTTFFQYIACTLFDDNEQQEAVRALRRAADNIASCRRPTRNQLPLPEKETKP